MQKQSQRKRKSHSHHIVQTRFIQTTYFSVQNVPAFVAHIRITGNQPLPHKSCIYNTFTALMSSYLIFAPLSQLTTISQRKWQVSADQNVLVYSTIYEIALNDGIALNIYICTETEERRYLALKSVFHAMNLFSITRIDAVTFLQTRKYRRHVCTRNFNLITEVARFGSCWLIKQCNKLLHVNHHLLL